jgi:hypothetical protein
MTSFDDVEPANGRGAATVALAAEHLSTDDDLPLPQDVRTVFQGGTFFLLLLGACYLADEIVLPIVLAFVLMLVLQPTMRFLEQRHMPRGLVAVGADEPN